MKKSKKSPLTGTGPKLTLHRMRKQARLCGMKPKTQVVDIQQQCDDLLAKAMKQPGVKSVMDVFEAADKYDRQSAEYANFIDWQRFPTSFSSCHTTELA